MTRLLQKRLIAALLPFSFLWAFVACVSICERETLASHPPTELSSSNDVNEIRHAPECDGCPLSYFPKAATPERVNPVFALISSASFAAATALIPTSDTEIFVDRDRPFLNGSPPLRLLSTLRI